MGQTKRVAVLGAGISGAVAARRLIEAGLGVTVFDKGRGIGGRMATRRVADSGLAFDHGAQFMRAQGANFSERLADWTRRGVAGAWDALGGSVGIPGMTAPVRDLLEGIDTRSDRTVTRIERTDGVWRLAIAEGAEDDDFDAVAVSFPSPQVAKLMKASGLALPGLDVPVYAPCWSLMLACERDCPLQAGPLSDGSGAIAQMFREDSKPGRSAETVQVVVHATPEWSRAHLEETREQVTRILVGAIETSLGTAVRPIHASAHRWRYALVETALNEDCIYESSLKLGACGDWCLGPRVEAAYDSGAALAARMIADLA
ncbi:NAD(P)-binding protein [Methylobacterium sp. 77]|uniref:NAD(P)/FAD-dependent oxidoreductase n=1 Tax=Methylobacterium sp. 77 TaxID=1101192 RepID=UPI000368B980|nr:NAD(P)-binding protein [Methylobacterium sp. 77]